MNAFDGALHTLGGIGVFGLPFLALTPGLLAVLVLLLPLVAVGLLAFAAVLAVRLALRQRPTRARTQAGMRRRAAPSASRSAPAASVWTPAP